MRALIYTSKPGQGWILHSQSPGADHDAAEQQLRKSGVILAQQWTAVSSGDVYRQLGIDPSQIQGGASRRTYDRNDPSTQFLIVLAAD